jgi:hypothetical protein
MKINILFVLSLVLILISCKKDQNKSEDEFISGKFGSDSFHFTYPFYHTDKPDTNSNVAYSFGFISIYRNDAKIPTKCIGLILQSSWIDSLQLNEALPYAELQLYDINCPMDTTWGVNDSCNYFGGTYNQGVDIRITDKKDDVLTGKFSGVIQTRTGLSKVVTDGRFRIKLIRSN